MITVLLRLNESLKQRCQENGEDDFLGNGKQLGDGDKKYVKVPNFVSLSDWQYPFFINRKTNKEKDPVQNNIYIGLYLWF